MPVFDEHTGLDISAIPEEYRAHYLAWVVQYPHDDDRIAVTRCVSLALAEDPEMIDRDAYTWPKIRDIGDRIERAKYGV